MCVANEINKKIKKDSSKLLIGTIAPDISKQVGESKVNSYFFNDDKDDTLDLDKFLKKYKDYLSDNFVLGYYIHLYTDYLWFKNFLPKIVDDDLITKLGGTKVKCNGRMLSLYVYNDYTNLNKKLLDEYELDCKIFYNEIPKLEYLIDEIPMDKIN